MKVLVVFTGGTVGSAVHPDTNVAHLPTGDAATYAQRWLDKAVSATRDLASGIEFTVTTPVMGWSEDFGPPDWLRISQEIAALQGGADGVIVAHGTDTILFSAAAASFLLSPADTPVVFTGSALAPGIAGSRAWRHFRDALILLKHGLSPSVYVLYGHDNLDSFLIPASRAPERLLYGCRSSCDACVVEARVRANGRVVGGRAAPPVAIRHKFIPYRAELVPEVTMHRWVPGMDPRHLTTELRTDRKCVLIETFHIGTLPTQAGNLGDAPSVTSAIRELVSRGVPVLLFARPQAGRVARYPSHEALEAAGARALPRLEPHVALTKTMWGFSQSADAGESGVDMLMKIHETDVAGELSLSNHRPTQGRSESGAER